MMADLKMKGSRLLRKLIPGCVGVASLIEPYLTFSDGKQNGWEVVVNDNAIPYLVYRTYFDTEGWSKEEISAFISGAAFQESAPWICTGFQVGGTFSAELVSWDILSKAHLPDSMLDGTHWVDGAGYFGWNAPGMSFSNYNLEEIFAGRYRQYIPNSTLGTLLSQTDENIWGAGDATAGNRIHITRVIDVYKMLTTDPDDTVIVVPPMAVIVPAILADESDLVYMERLRRSYVNAESR